MNAPVRLRGGWTMCAFLGFMMAIAVAFAIIGGLAKLGLGVT
jgi:hypothetical protein